MADWINKRLTLKLTLIIITLTMAFSGGISLILYQRSIISLEKESYGRLEQMVRAYGSELDVEVTNTMQITDSLGTLMEGDFDIDRLKREPDYLDRQIQRFDPYVKVLAQEFSLANTAYIYYNWELDGRVHDIYYVDHDRDGSVSRQEQLPISYYQGGESDRGSKAWWFGPVNTQNGYWSPPYKWVFDDGSSVIFVSYTQAVFKDGQLVGVAGTDFKYENLLTLMKNIKVYNSGYPFLINGDKSFLIHPTQEGKSLAELKQEPYKALREEIPFKINGAFRFQDENGESWFIAYQRLRNDWTLGLAAPVSEVTETTRTMTHLFLWILIASIPLISLGALWIARRVTLPIQELTGTVLKMTEGDYSSPMSSKILQRQDELGMLGDALSRLGLSLEEASQESLECSPTHGRDQSH